VNKERFNELIRDYSQLDSQQKDLENLTNEFPYSQPVRMLNVKSSSGLSKKEYQQRIALAAFYTTDRNVLRSLIEKGKVPSDFGERPARPIKELVTVEKKQVTATVKQQRPKIKAQPSKPVITESKEVDGKQLRDEVLVNLEILQQTKATFLKQENLEDATIKKVEKKAAKKIATVNKSPKKPAAKSVEKPVAKPVAVTPTTKAKKVTKSPRSKKDELIDKFIADSPSITRGKAVKENQSDLSKTSSELKEDLVSENLAIIFAKQGKASKAIEIYKKLIWKFPQKKASFAARIEELNKK
jgi:hypothetical protein